MGGSHWFSFFVRKCLRLRVGAGVEPVVFNFWVGYRLESFLSQVS